MTDRKTSTLVLGAACAGVLLWAADAAARPAVRHSVSEPAMTLQACLERARAALDAELLQVGSGDAYSVTGASPNYSVVISCTPVGRRMQVEVFTAADPGSDPSALHGRLVQGLGGDRATAGAGATGGTSVAGATGGAAAGTAGTAGATAGVGAATTTGTSATAGAAAGSTMTGGTTTGGTASGAAASATGTGAGAPTTTASTGGAATGGAAGGGDGTVRLTSEWHLVREAQISGQNDRTLEGQTVNQCLAACEADGQCESVEFHRSLGRCVLGYRSAKTSVNTFRQHVCTDYYSRDPGDAALLQSSNYRAAVPPEYGTWRKTPEAVVYGRSYIIREMPGSVIACADACAADPGCKSFNHYPNIPECHLLKVTACEIGSDFWGNSTSAMYHYTQEGSAVFAEAPAGTPPKPLASPPAAPGASDQTAATAGLQSPPGDPGSRFSTDFGDLIFRSLRPGPVTANDPTGVGTVVGDLDGTTLIGRWLRNDGGQRCATAFQGSRNWGRLEFRFDAALSRFVGRFGFCDGPLETTWSGALVPAAATAGQSERTSDTATWTVDYGSFEATAEQIDSSPAGDGYTSYYLAPGSFIGDWRGYSALAFDKKSWGGDYYDPDSHGASGDVVLESGDKSARFDIAAEHSGNWQSYRIPLDGTGWTLTGAASLAEVLADVTGFRIRAEYGAGTDYSALRGVTLIP